MAAAETRVGTVTEGRVRWFDDAKGYGFIEAADGVDVFVHYSAIQMDGFRNLREGQTVQFESVETGKGRMAQKVSILSQAVR